MSAGARGSPAHIANLLEGGGGKGPTAEPRHEGQMLRAHLLSLHHNKLGALRILLCHLLHLHSFHELRAFGGQGGHSGRESDEG